MARRYTDKDAQTCFLRLAKAEKMKTGPAYKRLKSGKLKANVGTAILDTNHTYGGHVVEVIDNDRGGVYQPFGYDRKSSKEFCEAVNFHLAVEGEKERKRAERRRKAKKKTM